MDAEVSRLLDRGWSLTVSKSTGVGYVARATIWVNGAAKYKQSVQHSRHAVGLTPDEALERLVFSQELADH